MGRFKVKEGKEQQNKVVGSKRMGKEVWGEEVTEGAEENKAAKCLFL